MLSLQIHVNPLESMQTGQGSWRIHKDMLVVCKKRDKCDSMGIHMKSYTPPDIFCMDPQGWSKGASQKAQLTLFAVLEYPALLPVHTLWGRVLLFYSLGQPSALHWKGAHLRHLLHPPASQTKQRTWLLDVTQMVVMLHMIPFALKESHQQWHLKMPLEQLNLEKIYPTKSFHWGDSNAPLKPKDNQTKPYKTVLLEDVKDSLPITYYSFYAFSPYLETNSFSGSPYISHTEISRSFVCVKQNQLYNYNTTWFLYFW